MGKVVITTGWNDPGYKLYGKNFASGFAQFWPAAYDMAAYTETPVRVPRGETRSLWGIPGVGAFIARHKHDPEACGTKVNKLWRPKHVTRGYNFRFDAVKFCRQMFIPMHASAVAVSQAVAVGRDPAEDIIVWLDGDVITDKTVPDQFIESTLGDADLCYLGRTQMHSEIGFWACRNNPRGRLFMHALAAIYESDAVFKLAEWHSAYVFDHCRQDQARSGDLQVRNLTPTGHGHVWFQSALGEFSDHLKGDTRKRKGASIERTMARKHTRDKD